MTTSSASDASTTQIDRPQSATGSPPPPPPSPGPRPRPPEWLLETFFKTLGKTPGAAGKLLDRVAARPLIGSVVVFFSSVWIGIVWLFCLGLYIGIGSGLPNLRAKLEMTDLQFFDAWPMRIILTGLAITLIVVTLRRIPLTLFKLGVWTVHIGILTLIGGAVWYFSNKVEGSVRIYLNQHVGWFYDATERSLYAYKMNGDGTVDEPSRSMVPLPTLPFFYEHIQERKNPLDLPIPQSALAKISPALNDAHVTITGYYPAADLAPMNWRPARPDEKGGMGHAIALQLNDGMQTFSDSWLVAGVRSSRLLEFQQFAIEYLYHPTPERIRDLSASFDSAVGMTVRIPKLHIERTYTLDKPGPIPIEGSPYTITPQGISEMPMLSKGYENTQSSVLTVHVTRQDAPDKTFEFDRMSVFRYPERSPDFINVNGKPVRKQNGVDPDIQIIFHDASKPQIWIVEDDSGQCTLIGRGADGRSLSTPFGPDRTLSLPAGFPKLQIRISQEADNVAETFGPRIIPAEQRQRGQTAMDAMQDSIVELRIIRGDWTSGPVYVPFVQFAQIGDPPIGRQPTVVDVPGVGPIGLILSTTERELPSDLQLTDFKAIKYPGASRTYENYISTLRVTPKSAGEPITLTPQLNDPVADHGLYYFQAAWDGDDNAAPAQRFSVIGVGNRPGVITMAVGALLMVLGIGYSFYVKPILLNMKKRELAEWAARKN
ncbi:MAG TPA: hypothetical protein VM008_03785 [Phycisphaerae bacterium]|nr:hypothetical protein [Phycisphaerae bacterium]